MKLDALCRTWVRCRSWAALLRPFFVRQEFQPTEKLVLQEGCQQHEGSNFEAAHVTTSQPEAGAFVRQALDGSFSFVATGGETGFTRRGGLWKMCPLACEISNPCIAASPL